MEGKIWDIIPVSLTSQCFLDPQTEICQELILKKGRICRDPPLPPSWNRSEVLLFPISMFVFRKGCDHGGYFYILHQQKKNCFQPVRFIIKISLVFLSNFTRSKKRFLKIGQYDKYTSLSQTVKLPPSNQAQFFPVLSLHLQNIPNLGPPLLLLPLTFLLNQISQSNDPPITFGRLPNFPQICWPSQD